MKRRMQRRVFGLIFGVGALCGASVTGCASEPRVTLTEQRSFDDAALLPAGIRRLSAREYDAVASNVLGVDVQPSEQLPLDARQQGFSTNADAIVDPLFASELDALARTLAEQAVSTRLNELAPCAALATPECRASLVDHFGSLAFRRPLTSDEHARYEQVFVDGQAGGDFAGGLELLLSTLLESPNLLYLTELGDTDASVSATRSELSNYEVASELAFTLTGAPPDAALLTAAASGVLLDPSERVRQAQRLLGEYATRFQFRRFVEEWFGVDGIASVAKDAATFPDFAGLRPAMLEETADFIDHVMIEKNASVRALLAAGFSVVPSALGSFYAAPSGANGESDVSAVGRVGLLQQASFLASYAHESESAPVLRGVFVLRKLLCRQIPNPTDLGIEIVFPPPDPSATTRQRYAVHAENPSCASCHDAIDSAGFSFENFDAEGKLRSTDAGQPVDTSGSITLESGSRSVRDSVELAQALADAPEVERCLQRQILRFASGRSAPDSEQAFVDFAGTLAPAAQESVVELVLAFVRSELFVQRRLQ